MWWGEGEEDDANWSDNILYKVRCLINVFIIKIMFHIGDKWHLRLNGEVMNKKTASDSKKWKALNML